MPKRKPTASEQRHRARIAAMPCILCETLGQPQESRTSVHHIRSGQGVSQRASDYLAIPLCKDGCHQGSMGIHGDRTLLRIANMDELGLLAMTYERLMEGAA